MCVVHMCNAHMWRLHMCLQLLDVIGKFPVWSLATYPPTLFTDMKTKCVFLLSYSCVGKEIVSAMASAVSDCCVFFMIFLVLTCWWLTGCLVVSASCVPYQLHLLLIHTWLLPLLLSLGTLWGSLYFQLLLMFFWDGILNLRGSTWSADACFCSCRLIVPSLWMDHSLLDRWVVCFAAHP